MAVQYTRRHANWCRERGTSRYMTSLAGSRSRICTNSTVPSAQGPPGCLLPGPKGPPNQRTKGPPQRPETGDDSEQLQASGR